MRVIVGLGNPGPEYEDTRHNIGFKAIEELAKITGVSELKMKNKLQAFIGEAVVGNCKIILAQPTTFMNNSGIAVSAILSWYKVPPEKLIVIYDDVDLEVGQIRLRSEGGAGGHHGVESIIAHIPSANFNRVRIGIGRNGLFGDVSNYVLGKIPSAEREPLGSAIIKAAEAALSIVSDGMPAAMNRFNA
ncbi:MAG: aminoacyl-tRNA hydrolase [Candidatus Margulisiibacteriota bacterium]